MRIAVTLLTGLLGLAVATPAAADIKTELAACLAAAKAKAKAAGYTNQATDRASREMDLCSEAADRAWDREHPKEAASDDSYYEFQDWKANEDYKREVGAINRNYDLRRSGVLP